MDLQNLFHTQKEFDKGFVDHDKRDRIKKKFFALLVEQGEAANESPATFKYWSSNPKGASLKTAEKYAELYGQPIIPVMGDPLLEELVDKLHFILSLGNELEISQHVHAIQVAVTDDLVDMHLYFAHYVSNMYLQYRVLSKEDYNNSVIIGSYTQILKLFFGIALALGYSEHDIEAAYYRKNKINYERQENGY